MKYKTLFRLMLKVIGVWMFVSGVASLIAYTVYLVQSLAEPIGGSSAPLRYLALQIVVPIVQLGAGLYLFFDGRWIADKAIPGNRPYCHECGYDLTGATGHVCNECGTAFKPAA